MNFKNIAKFMLLSFTAAIVSSCSNNDLDTDPNLVADNAKLTINLSSTQSRAVEAPGTAVVSGVDYAKSYLFVATSTGAIKKTVALDNTSATPAGQVVTGVPPTGLVYVLANVPVADQATVMALVSVKSIQEYAIETSAAGTFPDVVLSNATGAGAAYTATGTPLTAHVALNISPAMSRVELGSIQVTNPASEIESFDLTGVYLDSLQTQFTLAGTAAGTLIGLGQDIALATHAYYMDDYTTAPLVSVTNKVEAPTAGGTMTWAYQVPAGDAPHIVIGLKNVKLKDGSFLDGGTGTKDFYITAKLTGAVNRANVYQVNGGITFDESNLHDTSNPDLTSATIEVEVTVLPWAVNLIGYTIE